MASMAAVETEAEPAVNLPVEPARHWANYRRLSSILPSINAFLAARPFERAPWLAVAFLAGIASWLELDGPWQWSALLAACAAVAALALTIPREGALDYVRLAVLSLALMVAAGCVTVWSKSALVGKSGVARPTFGWVQGRILDRQEESARGRVRLLIQARMEGMPDAMRVRVNLPLAQDRPVAQDRPATEDRPVTEGGPGLAEGATVRLRARLMPPAPPMLPGGYDFARAAWFQGLAATGSVVGPVDVLAPPDGGGLLRRWQQELADHIRARLGGSPGTIAAALASGDRGSIAPADEDAMRDAGLTHLLSISGLHVSAVIAAVYFLTVRLFALFPFVALRVRLPIVAAAAGALAGIAYTLVTGSEVPTVRSCIGALLVLAALALGRDPLSLRLLAVAAFFVMVFWPEAVFGPSFQMSFASVIAIIAFHGSAPAKRFLAARDEGVLPRLARHLVMLLATGLVIELALMPIGLFHFHRAGIYGAAANVVAIPLTTFVTMPLIALALALDVAGAGGPAWWLTGKSLELLLWLAHVTAGQPGAVTLMPSMPPWVFALFVAGGLWLALWTGTVRLWGFAPAAVAALVFATMRPPDILISGDGRHVGITGEGAELLVLRQTRGDYTRENLLEMAGMEGEVRPLDTWPGAACNADFCRITLTRGGRTFAVLMARGQDLVEIGELKHACAAADIVIADRRAPACRGC